MSALGKLASGPVKGRRASLSVLEARTVPALAPADGARPVKPPEGRDRAVPARPFRDDTYAFGDSDVAARRLELLASTFAATTQRFLRAQAITPPALAVDLGCGPGYTTELIRDAVHPARMIAVDISPAHVAMAAERLASDRVQAVRADVLNLPGWVTGADIMFARLLLTHLREPRAAIEHWRQRLSPRGALLIEEVESIATTEPALSRYLDLQREMLAANGHALEIGASLDAMLRGRTSLRSSRTAVFSPPATTAARMFSMNFPAWRTRREVTARHDQDELDTIAAALDRICNPAASSGAITWQLRQIVITR